MFDETDPFSITSHPRRRRRTRGRGGTPNETTHSSSLTHTWERRARTSERKREREIAKTEKQNHSFLFAIRSPLYLSLSIARKTDEKETEYFLVVACAAVYPGRREEMANLLSALFLFVEESNKSLSLSLDDDDDNNNNNDPLSGFSKNAWGARSASRTKTL